MKHHYTCVIRRRVNEDESVHRFVDSIIHYTDDMMRKELSDQLIQNILTEPELEELKKKQGFVPSNIRNSIHFMKLRARFNTDMSMHLFHTSEYIDEDEMCHIIQTLDIKKINESKI